MVKYFGLDRQYKNIKDELLDATDSVLSSGSLNDGEYSKKFAPKDSVIIINVDNEKVTKYGYAIHWDKDISFY